MTEKMVALCLLRLLPRGGSRFRVWLGKKLVRTEFERQTRKLRAWRVFLQREHVSSKDYYEPHDKKLREEIRHVVELAHNTQGFFKFWKLIHLQRRRGKWIRWSAQLH